MSVRSDKLPEVSLRLLEIFSAMMRCGTTVETADQLDISQPAVSAGLRQLEKQLGLSLFERTGRRLVPTAEARELFEEIRPVFGLMRGFALRARDMKLGLTGRLRVVATPPLGHSVAPMALRRLLRDGPNLSISFEVLRFSDVIEAVHNGQADVGLALAQDRSDQVNFELLQRAHMVALVPRDSLLAARDHLTPADLADQPMIGLSEDSSLGRLVRAGFAHVGVDYLPRIEVRYCQTATMLAAEELGVTVVDPYSARSHAPSLVSRPFLPVCEVHAALFTRRGVPHTGLTHRFISLLRSCLSEIPAAASAR